MSLLPTKKQSFMALGAALVILGSICAGFYFAGYANGESHAKTVQAVKTVEKVVTEYKQIEGQRIEVVKRDLKRETELQSKLTVLETKNRNLEKILNAQPVESDECRLPVGTVRLLNAAKAGAHVSDQAELSDPSGVAAYQERTPSTISCRVFSLDAIAVYAQYNELAERHDMLVDWVKTETPLNTGE